MDNFEETNLQMDSFTQNLEFWMTNLPKKLKDLPIIHLAIPGSHDSITYGITRKSPISPDAEQIVRDLRFLGPLVRLFTIGWSKTQTINVQEQLKQGIRYFDLRIATKKRTETLYFVHGMYSVEVREVLEEMDDFLNSHPYEVIILDCQHFYAFKQSDHEALMCLLTSIFAHKLVPYSPRMEHLSLRYMTQQFRYQVILIYRSDAARFGQPLLWPSNCFPTPWANTVSIPFLIDFLSENLKKRNCSFGFISQCVLTPSVWFVVKHFFGSLKNQCAIPLEKEKLKWLQKQKPGKGGVNIIISDFVDYQDCNFPREVVGLNQKLLDLSPRNSFLSKDEISKAITPVDGMTVELF